VNMRFMEELLLPMRRANLPGAAKDVYHLPGSTARSRLSTTRNFTPPRVLCVAK